MHVRNLVIISRAAGSGIVSASLITGGNDSLTGISGKAYKVDGSAGAPFTSTLTSPVLVSNGVLEVLTDRNPLITVSDPDLKAGLEAEVTLQFAKSGQHTTRVPGHGRHDAPLHLDRPPPTASP